MQNIALKKCRSALCQQAMTATLGKHREHCVPQSLAFASYWVADISAPLSTLPKSYSWGQDSYPWAQPSELEGEDWQHGITDGRWQQLLRSPTLNHVPHCPRMSWQCPPQQPLLACFPALTPARDLITHQLPPQHSPAASASAPNLPL